MNTSRTETGREADREAAAIVERLKSGDLSAMALVTRENVIRLLEQADGNLKVETLLRQKL